MKKGANVVICCRSGVWEAEEVRRLAEANGARALVVQADLGSEEGAAMVVDRRSEAFGDGTS